MYFAGSYYLVYTDFAGEHVYRIRRISNTRIQELSDEGGFLGELIQRRHKKEAPQ